MSTALRTTETRTVGRANSTNSLLISMPADIEAVAEQVFAALAGSRVALTATLGLAAACWVIALRQMSGMDMGISTDLGSFGFFLAAWVPMMAAMMLPSAAPAVARRAQSSSGLGSVALFVS